MPNGLFPPAVLCLVSCDFAVLKVQNRTMTEEALLGSKNDGDLSHVKATRTDFGHADRQVQPGLELRFENLSFKIKDKQILEDVSGTAHPGKVMAVMGPSGSGKTTLLNIIGGRVKCSNCKATIGGQPLTKKTRRKISYVLQQDIFFPNLTLQQTLMFSAELRLPESMPLQTKKQIVAELIEQLDMEKCKHTIIGDNMTRGLSGGEKKRANIANELLTDPAVLLLDEPTSGLDSSTAYALTLSLKKYAVHSGKTVMMTIHQPSIQMFVQFDTVLLLSGGQIAYYGSPKDVLPLFNELGYNCDVTRYNPADFILDIVKSGEDASNKLISASNRRRLTEVDCPILKSTVNAFEAKLSGKDEVVVIRDSPTTVEDLNDNNSIPMSKIPDSENQLNGGRHVSRDTAEPMNGKCPFAGHATSIESRAPSNNSLDEDEKRWPTSSRKQIAVLAVRSFIQGKYRYLSTLKFIKTFGVALICGLVWWQAGRGEIQESVVVDLTSVLFFVNVFNSFNSLFDVLVVFPSEREVVNKERMGGSYRLSSYYIAKTISEAPLTIVLPSISTVIVYWMAGLNGFNDIWAFFGTWLVMILVTFTAQSLGMFVSTATMDFEHGLVLAIFLMISFMLLGGFYVKNIPPWLSWMAYLSPIYFSWSLMLLLEFNSDTRVLCDNTTSAFESCVSTPERNSTGYVLSSDILQSNSVNDPAWVCVVSLLAMLVGFRVIGYIMLRLFHKPIVK
uniref:ABC transporter G family member 14-like n=1 Tax=Phallusia mammillata TaxID=59560 RepID=A0A6F9D6A3_9ASCI|nr:ABC transporter G family member 14-like [Phallusia mammillata]